MDNRQRVVCAAIRHADGRIIAGPRHFDSIMHGQIQACGPANAFLNADQVFLDQWGNFLTRDEAWEVAMAAGQILKRVGGDNGKLFSENLY